MASTEELTRALAELGDTATIERVDALNALAYKIGFNDIERTHALALEAIELGRELDYPRGIGWGLLNAAYRDYATADYERALSKGLEALTLFESSEDTYGTANMNIGIGLVYWSLGDFELAVSYLHNSVSLFRELGKDEREGFALTSLGSVYENVGDLDKALDYHKQALALFEADNDKVGLGRVLTGIAAVERRRGQLDDALAHSFQSLELSRDDSHRFTESRALNDIGNIYAEKGEHDKARDFLLRGLKLRRETDNRSAEATSLLDLGALLTQTGEVEAAIDHFEQALRIAEAAKTRPKIYRAHEGLARAYEAMGNHAKALEHHRRFHELKEEVQGEQSATKLKNLQIRFEAETHEQLKLAQARLIQSEKMASLGKLVAGVSHELNTPVGVILSTADLVDRALARFGERLSSEDDGLRRELAAMRDAQGASVRAGRRLETILESLKRFTRLDESEFQSTDVREGIESTLALLAPSWGERVLLEKELAPVPLINGYPSELNQALMTLLSNAAEAVEGEGTVRVETDHEGEAIRVRVSDTGRGIPEDKVESIFDVGFVTRGAKIRLHVGLANVQAVVAKHNGTIGVDSTVGAGTTFQILLPVPQSAG